MAEFEMDKELHMGAKIGCFEVGIYSMDEVCIAHASNETIKQNNINIFTYL